MASCCHPFYYIFLHQNLCVLHANPRNPTMQEEEDGVLLSSFLLRIPTKFVCPPHKPSYSHRARGLMASKVMVEATTSMAL